LGARLVEELVRQGDLPVADHLDVADQADVGDAVGRAGGDGGRHLPVEQARQLRERDHEPTRWPAPGPGVCAKTSSDADLDGDAGPARPAAHHVAELLEVGGAGEGVVLAQDGRPLVLARRAHPEARIP
jgi:hypothetical protein